MKLATLVLRVKGWNESALRNTRVYNLEMVSLNFLQWTSYTLYAVDVTNIHKDFCQRSVKSFGVIFKKLYFGGKL